MQPYHQGILRTLLAASPGSTALIQPARRGLSSGRSRPKCYAGFSAAQADAAPPSPAQHSWLPMRAAAGALYRPRARRGKMSGVLSRVAPAECPRYFKDQVTGRLVERSG